MKVFFHKVKKALKVDEEKALPPRLQHRYHKLKKYEAKLRKVYESIRVLLIRDPAEVKRAREKTTKGPFEPGEDSGIYQNLYRPLRKHKTLFSQYKVSFTRYGLKKMQNFLLIIMLSKNTIFEKTISK